MQLAMSRQINYEGPARGLARFRTQRSSSGVSFSSRALVIFSDDASSSKSADGGSGLSEAGDW